MKRLTTVIAVFLMTALFAGQAWSAEAPKASTDAPKRNTIFEYKVELSLSDAQVKKMRDILNDLNKENRLILARRTLADADLKSLLDKEADIKQIRAKLKEIADLAIEGRIYDIASAREINAVMSSTQLKKWRQIQTSERNK